MADDVARHDLRAPLSSTGVALISVSGAPAQCGAGYGAAAADLIADNVDRYLRRFRDEAGLSRAAVRVAGGTFRNASRAVHPRVTDMLDGLAEGAGVHVDEIYALNARTELLYGARSGASAVAGHPDGAAGGCTAAGVLGTHTADGHLLLGQNWDWHPDQRDTMVMLRTVDERGDAVLTLAEAGMLAKSGLNSAGLGVCVNMLGTDRDGLSAGRTPGVPYHVLLRAVLEAGSLGHATRVACRTPRNASINLLIGQAGPGGGELLDLEVVPGDVGWLHPADGVLTHANHLESALAVRDMMKDLGGSSLFRGARARRLLVERARRGPLGFDALTDVFHDHLGLPMAICRHLDDRDTPADQAETVYSVLLDLDNRRLGLAAGPPCRHDYEWLELTDDRVVSEAAPRVPAATTGRARN